MSVSELPAEKSVKLTKVVEVSGYCEGIVFDHSGNAYISDTQNRKVYRIASDGRATPWAETGAPNGHKVLADGTHLVCGAVHYAVLRLDQSGKVLGKAAFECDGQPLRAPNDLTLDPRGGFYFTDPGGSDATLLTLLKKLLIDRTVWPLDFLGGYRNEFDLDRLVNDVRLAVSVDDDFRWELADFGYVPDFRIIAGVSVLKYERGIAANLILPRELLAVAVSFN